MMHTTGTVNLTAGEQGWKSAFNHEGEIAQPMTRRTYSLTWADKFYEANGYCRGMPMAHGCIPIRLTAGDTLRLMPGRRHSGFRMTFHALPK